MLNATKVFLPCTIPARVFHKLPVAGRQQMRNANVQAHRLICLRKDFGLALAGRAGIPFPRPAGDADGLDCADNLTMPAHGDTSDAADFEPPPVYLKTVAEFFQAKGVELVLAFVPRIARSLTRLNTAEEVLKRFIQVGGDHLQNVGDRHLRLHEKRVQVRQRVFPCQGESCEARR